MNLDAVLHDENFEGYLTDAELQAAWIPTGSGGTLTLGNEDYTTTGQRHHALLTFAGAAASAGIRSVATRANGVYIPADGITQVAYTMGYRYKADPELAGMGLTVSYAHSAFGGSSVITPTCDGEWHSVTESINDFAESSLAGGWHVTATDVPAAGDFRVDDLTITRTSPMARVIDNTCPIAAFRWNGEGGFLDRWQYRTNILTARDGTETREQMRLFPRRRLEYETRAHDAADAARINAWLTANHGQRVAVPLWVDQLVFNGVFVSNTEINLTGGTTDDRQFEPNQRIMVWDSPTSYEAVQTWQIETSLIRLDANVNTLDGAWTAGVSKVVPLLPARLDATLALRRPNPSLGIIPLAFDVEVAQ